MSFRANKSGVSHVRLLFRFSEIESMCLSLNRSRKDAIQIERRAETLAANGFPARASHSFMVAVINWGRGNRFLDRAKKQNRPRAVANALLSANERIVEEDFAGAVDAVAQLRYVGHSFATKHVRMMCPDRAGTLDSRIREKLGFTATNAGYVDFLAELERLKALILESPEVPPNIRKQMRICDVEMLVYSALESK